MIRTDNINFATPAVLWNALASHFETPLPFGQGQIILRESTLQDLSGGILFQISLRNGSQIFAHLREFPIAQVTGTQLTFADILDLPDALREGLILGAVDILQNMLPPNLAAQLGHIVPMTRGEAPDCPIWIETQIDLAEGARALCSFGAHRTEFTALFQTSLPQNALQIPLLPGVVAADIPVHLKISAAQVKLPLNSLHALETGDVILVPIDLMERSIEIAGHTVSLVHTQNEDGSTSWLIKEIKMASDTDLPPADHAQQHGPDAGNAEQTDLPTDDTPVDLGAIPIRFQVVVQSHDTTLEALQTMVPGSIMPFDIDDLSPGLPVELFANGARIGTGHLIQIDDTYGLRVHSIGRLNSPAES